MITYDRSIYRYYDKEGEVRSLSIKGHRVLVRKCAKPDTAYLLNGGKPTHTPSNPEFAPEPEMIMGTLTGKTHENMCEVLAIGKDCGVQRTKKELKRKGFKSEPIIPIERGDIVVLPETSENLFNTVTGNIDDILIDEAELIAKVEQ